MVVVDTFVNDADDHVRVTGLDRPGAGGIDVATRNGIVARTVVDIVPLLGKKRVVEEDGRHIIEFDARDELHHIKIVQGRYGLARLGEWRIFIKVNVIPEMQAPGAMARFPLPCGRENAGHRCVRQGREVRTAGFRLDGISFKLHPDDARDAVVRRLDGYVAPGRSIANNGLLRTCRKQSKRESPKQNFSHSKDIGLKSTWNPLNMGGFHAKKRKNYLVIRTDTD